MNALLGMMGQKRSGKDTAAGFLLTERGFARYGFADALKAAAYHLNPLVGSVALPDSLVGEKRLRDVVDALGWEGAKECPEVRRTLQEYGMSIRAIEPGFWVSAAMRPAAAARLTQPVVITDVRFPNEADAIRAAGGRLVRVDRPGLPDDDGHASEHAWRSIEPDVVLVNDSTIEHLFEQVARIA